MENLIAIIILLIIISSVVTYIIKEKKKGKKCIGCPDGCSCSKSCGNKK